ncbi:hypothetical protein H632_c974p0, partial [Helicosporidium sp. ATCC 50920]
MSIRDIQCITASGDGVDPALLITLDCRPTVQYLVGAPEGFSRLALEQGVRPGLGLRAAFCHNVCAQLGLGSLIMRLRSDGHGYVHVVGPQGSSAHLGSLSEFISWQFPTVLCTELASGASEEAYEDEWLNAWSCRRGCDDEMLPAWLREELAQVLLAAHAESEEECSALEQLPVLRALKRARVEVALAAVSVPGSLVDSEALRGLRRSLPRAPVVLLPREPGWTLRPMHAEAPQALVCRVLEECRAELEESVRQRLLQRLPPLVQQACIGPRILENAPPCSSASPPPALQPDSNRRAAVRLREELLSRKRAKCANGGGPVPSSPAASVGSPLEPCFSDPDVDAETALGAGGARLLFLGTGSAEPSSHRGPSAILVQTSDPRASFLLDCGEGTAGALVRWLGPSGARAAALALSLVWISHRHADHMSGLPGLLRLRNVGEAAPLVVVGPLSLWRWLRGSASAQGVRFVPASAFACGDASRGCESSTAPASRWRTISSARAWDVASPPSLLPHAPFLLHAEPMQHCPDAWACVVRHVGSGWALAYSGDGTPSRRLARACRGCALLVHEATFEDDRAGDAAKKRHSTVSQALGVGQEAGVPA